MERREDRPQKGPRHLQSRPQPEREDSSGSLGCPDLCLSWCPAPAYSPKLKFSLLLPPSHAHAPQPPNLGRGGRASGQDLIPSGPLLSTRWLLRLAGPSGESWHPDSKLRQSVTLGACAHDPKASHLLSASCTGRAVTSCSAHS